MNSGNESSACGVHSIDLRFNEKGCSPARDEQPFIFIRIKIIRHLLCAKTGRKSLIFRILFYNCQLINQARAFSPFVHHIQYITDIYADCALQFGFESDIAAHGFPVSVESKTNQTAVFIEYRPSRVSACTVIIRPETKL